jgi:hypothetical protein
MKQQNNQPIISENISQKSRRGRPRVIERDFEPLFRSSMNLPYHTVRTVQSRAYIGNALKALNCQCAKANAEDAERWCWLLRPDKNGSTYCRKSIVSQLGRTRCVHALKVFADRLCDLKPTAQQAVGLLRGWQQRRDDLVASMIFDGVESFTDEELQEAAHQACLTPDK